MVFRTAPFYARKRRRPRTCRKALNCNEIDLANGAHSRVGDETESAPIRRLINDGLAFDIPSAVGV